MKRISVSFYDEIHEKLEERMKNGGTPSVAQCVRELVDLGLRIEASAKEVKKKDEENDVMTSVLELKKLLKNTLKWSLEGRLLARFLVKNHPSSDDEKRDKILDEYKSSANNYVDGLYGEKIE
jgi:metal-responsive CopG/Arc/MetJ family transcriptional regulator